MIDFKRHLSSLSKPDSSNTYATDRLKRRHHQPWGGSRRYAISSTHILSEKHLVHNIACMDTGGGLPLGVRDRANSFGACGACRWPRPRRPERPLRHIRSSVKAARHHAAANGHPLPNTNSFFTASEKRVV